MTGWNTVVARWTFAFLLAGVLAVVAIVVASFWMASRSANLVDTMPAARELRVLATRLQVALVQAESSQRGYLLAQDRKYLAPYEDMRPVLDELLHEFKKRLERAPGARPLTAQIIEIVTAKRAEMDQTLALNESGQRELALARVLPDDGRQMMARVDEILTGIINRAEAANTRRIEQLGADTDTLTAITFGGGIILVLLAFAAARIVARYTDRLIDAQREIETINAGLERRVRERTAALTHANEEIQRFAYIVTHDLRSPLVNIMGFTREIEVGVDTLRKLLGRELAGIPRDVALVDAAVQAMNGDLPEAISFIRASTSKMDGLINAILKLSREGQRKLRLEQVDLRTFLAASAASLKHVAVDAGAEIALVGQFPTIVTDRLALEQIVGNLLDNAVKYLKPGRAGKIVVSARECDERVEVLISDNGRGIAPQDHSRIFDLYRRAGPQDCPGEGIGLTYVRAMVLRLGGDIAVESTLGDGSTFTVNLPKVLDPKTD